MADATTNLQDVAADRLSIFNTATRRHDDVRDIFLNVSKVTEATSFAQQVGDEVDIILTYPDPQPQEVPSLAGIVAYIEQEKLGTGSVNNKYYTIHRTSTSLIHDAETVPLRGRRGATGERGEEGDSGARGSRGPVGEMVLHHGDTHITRITKHREVNQVTVNHADTQLLNVTKRSKHIRNDQVHFHEGGYTSTRNSVMHRRTTHNVDIFAPVFIQQVKVYQKVNRAIYIITP